MTNVKAGDYIDAGNDEGVVAEVKGEWVFYWSENTGNIAKRHYASLSVSPTPEQIAAMAKEIRERHQGQPQKVVNGPRPGNAFGKLGRRRNKCLMD